MQLSVMLALFGATPAIAYVVPDIPLQNAATRASMPAVGLGTGPSITKSRRTIHFSTITPGLGFGALINLDAARMAFLLFLRRLRQQQESPARDVPRGTQCCPIVEFLLAPISMFSAFQLQP